jgi:hypothetical protein
MLVSVEVVEELPTKRHLPVVGNCLPVQIKLSPGQMNDQPMAELLLNDLPAGARRHCGQLGTMPIRSET